MKRLLPLAALAAAVAIVAPATARAAQTTSSLTVNATVVASCVVTNATPLTFGNYFGAQLDASTNVTIRCNGDTSYWLAVGYGQNAAGTNRFMSDGTLPTPNLLQYALYRDAGRSELWTDDLPTPALPPGGYWIPATGGADSTQQVFGRIFANQARPTGSYSDSVTLTVIF